MQIVTGLSDELTRILFDLGPRKLVLVEGDDDAAILKAWYSDRLSRIYFYAAGGNRNIIRLLEELRGRVEAGRTYAIRDRDFSTTEQIEADRSNYWDHLFTLPRYAVENYILEGDAVWEELSLFIGEGFSVHDVASMQLKILNIFQGLQTMMAANWVFSEQKREDEVAHFRPGHEDSDRDTLIELAKRRLNLSGPEVRNLFAEREAVIASTLTSMESGHTYINGKHAFHRLHRLAITEQSGLSRNHLRDLLARTVKQRMGIPQDIREIIDDNILDKD
jgi:hypothetical protein